MHANIAFRYDFGNMLLYEYEFKRLVFAINGRSLSIFYRHVI